MHTDQLEKFLRDGWIIVDIPEPAIVQEFAAILEKKAQELTNSHCSLSTIHEHVDDEGLRTLNLGLADYFWEQEFSLKAGPAFLPLLKEMVGLDIMVQYKPYLRIARPNAPQDNIGYHKDTQYGQTPFELAVHIPFVDLDEHAALRVISGSHLAPESDYPSIEGVTTTVKKGDRDHGLGKPYLPQKLNPPEGKTPVPLTMRTGQAAMFTPAIFHGQNINEGNVTRVSTDLRFVNTNAKTDLTISSDKRAGYVPIASSPVEQAARNYFTAQKAGSHNKKSA